MCFMIPPMIALGISLAASAAAAGASAYGAHQQASAQAAAADYNAKTAVMQGQSVQDSARINEQNTYRQGDLLEGSARAAMGANGVDPNSGSALGVQRDIGRRTGQDVANQGYNADLTSYGYRNQATLDTAQAGFDKQAGDISETGTLLGAASQVAGKWAAWQQVAPPTSGGTNIAGAGSPSGWGSNGGSVGTGSWAGASFG